MNRFVFFASLLFWWTGLGPAAKAGPTQILLIAGPSVHPPGTHEPAAGARLLQYCLEHMENVPEVRAKVFDEWPKESSVLDEADTVVFTGDTFPPMRFPDPAGNLARLELVMRRGGGIVCLHFATGLGAQDVAADGEHPLLHWMGGYYAWKGVHFQSTFKRLENVMVTPAKPEHPVWHGCGEFTLNDEFYFHNYFGPDGNRPSPNVTILATALLPPGAPQREALAWGIERPDGGRGFAVVLPHYFKNWQHEELRRMILNGIVWTAKREVPAEGVRTVLPELASFAPASVEPQPVAAKAPAAAVLKP